MIYITGDTHGLEGLKERISTFEGRLGKQDYLIIAGDFGVIWDSQTLDNNLKELNNLPGNILFVDGNHENFDLLNAFPVSMWNGGKVHRICGNTLHLMRGQIFMIEGKRFFTFGGATSRDKEHRIEHISWWKEEEPSEDDYREAEKNLMRYGSEVDFVITHCPLASAVKHLFARSFDQYPYGCSKYRHDKNIVSYILSDFIEKIGLKARVYFSGHQHLDETINVYDQKFRLLYKDIVTAENIINQ